MTVAAQTPMQRAWPQPSHPAAVRVVSSRLLASTDTDTHSSTDSSSSADDNEKKKAASFCLTAVAARDIPAASLVARNTSTTLAAVKAYSTVQVSRDAHIELNSDLLYCNHSCDPNVRFVTSTLAADSLQGPPGASVAGALEVWSTRAIRAGEELRFFYPSTEWEMSQPFRCSCGAGQCLGWVDGASKTAAEVLQRYWLSDHIRALLGEKLDHAIDHR
ncbi:hypothetical protein TMEN_2647 [Trichophyton mentagrophytes]|uniref:Post-SET domain-containing protein n=1 Tax=Trichophyton interdigitale (strain MR816) TaxID=1215338 RepID=A0A059IZ40_TRIIM|nr:Post-SET domain-containing protein [Trichophyton interdigitale]KAG5218763.1 Post-SET domain-containing protein [Trichophyton interdigitale]KAG8207456.1 Post-SET domain-containing protein [Trichophyton interdigitale]KDB20779.1 hypothetical protein H109_07252 [Trichophyton interdigitale MR816]GBF60235.1 hypothetical protein TMEN_2647 [Trichophyton mentagrophytes]